jgi:RNA polymerase sigma-54 factor
MMKPSLQLRIGQQLTMTPQLQQAIRLLQLPTIELQAQVLEALESNVMLEPEEDFEATWPVDAMPGETAGAPAADEPVVEIGDDWVEPSAAESEAPGPGPATRSSSFPTSRGGRSATTSPGSSSSPTCRRMRSRSGARSSTPSTTTATSPKRPRLSPRRWPARRAPTRQASSACFAIVQQLDPAGVGARSVAECIELQLAQLDPATPGLAAARTLAIATSTSSRAARSGRCSARCT